MTQLGTKFEDRARFAPPPNYRLLPFRFGRLDERRYIATNDVGEYVLLSRQEIVAFVGRSLDVTSNVYRELKSKHFLFDGDSECALDLLALKYRSRAERISDFTGLHIFVVTLRCDHSCHYCQVSRQTEDKTTFDMSTEHAERALEFTFGAHHQVLKSSSKGANHSSILGSYVTSSNARRR